MSWFKIYAGLGGGFGGANYHGTYEYSNIDEALNYAYNLALEEYQSYEGCHGILSYEDVEADLRDSDFIGDDMSYDEIKDCVRCHYIEEVESWIEYHAMPATGPDDQDE